MRALGIDIGLKRTGLALSDELGLTVRILPNLLAHSQKDAVEKILTLVRDFSVTTLVIGRPEPRTSGSIAIASRADSLKKKLDEVIVSEKLDVKVYVWDEAMSSKQAMSRLNEMAVPEKKRRALLDGASAAILLEDFLARTKEK